jgi:hypothetical protein
MRLTPFLMIIASLALSLGVDQLPARAAVKKPAAPDPRREFVSACRVAFDKSSETAAQEFGAKVCECTIQESKHQGATLASIKSETAKIKADPKYKISDPKLLAAFQYCTIELLQHPE